MISRDYIQAMASYNGWMNEKLYAACDGLDDAARKADAAAFFRSIHSTLNHLIWGDGIWLGRFTRGTPLAKSYQTSSIGEDVYERWSDLADARMALDKDIITWAAGVERTWLEGDMPLGKSVRPAWLLVAHFFNHQTHHRGQVTTLLSQRGVDPGVTDLMAMP